MAIHRGIQSAMFYYLSCAPCAERRFRKKMRLEAEHSRAARDALADEIPNFYRQPGPSMTNPWWQREIDAGPTYKPRSKPPIDPSQVGYKNRPSGDTSGVPSSVTLSSGKGPHSISSQSKVATYQREDEQLWGSTPTLTIQKPTRARVADSPSGYQNYRNPAVSDMHPATVTKVHSRSDIMWMMQPPPVAEVMNGKERPPTRDDWSHHSPQVSPRSRPTTRHSNRRSGKPASSLGDEVIDEAFEQDLQTDNLELADESPTKPKRALINTHDFALTNSNDRRHSSYVAHNQNDQNRIDSPLKDQSWNTSTASREPKPRLALSKVMSESRTTRKDFLQPYLQPSPKFLYEAKENAAPQMRSSLTGHEHSEDPCEDHDHEFALEDGMDLPTWIHEHTKRDVQKRWSMDF